MSSLLAVLDPDLNFWEANPNFKSIKEFRLFMETDKSKNKDYSSRVMWAIAFCCDKSIENTWRNVPMEEAMPLLAEDVIGEKDFDWAAISDLIYIYESRVLSLPEKDLRNFEKKLHERQQFIDKTAYTLDSFDENGKPLKGTATQLDKMMADTNKIYAQLQELKAIYEKAEEEGHVRGGREESASELGLI